VTINCPSLVWGKPEDMFEGAGVLDAMAQLPSPIIPITFSCGREIASTEPRPAGSIHQVAKSIQGCALARSTLLEYATESEHDDHEDDDDQQFRKTHRLAPVRITSERWAESLVASRARVLECRQVPEYSRALTWILVPACSPELVLVEAE
jgi:hypothetical protein